jgi:hypothetical protein
MHIPTVPPAELAASRKVRASSRRSDSFYHFLFFFATLFQAIATAVRVAAGPPISLYNQIRK